MEKENKQKTMHVDKTCLRQVDTRCKTREYERKNKEMIINEQRHNMRRFSVVAVVVVIVLMMMIECSV
jgi:ribosomal protein L28